MAGAMAMIVPAMRVRAMRVRDQEPLLWLRMHTVLNPRVPAYRCPDLGAAVSGCAAGADGEAGDWRSGGRDGRGERVEGAPGVTLCALPASGVVGSLAGCLVMNARAAVIRLAPIMATPMK